MSYIVSAVRKIRKLLSGPEPPEALPRGPFRVLVVDDEPAVRVFVERVLQEAGHVVVTASDGPAALSTMEGEAAFDLIVSDVRMPGMSGPQFIERARSERSSVMVLYLTAYNDELFKERMALTDDEAFLDKPPTVKGLLEAVTVLLRGQLRPAQVS